MLKIARAPLFSKFAFCPIRRPTGKNKRKILRHFCRCNPKFYLSFLLNFNSKCIKPKRGTPPYPRTERKEKDRTRHSQRHCCNVGNRKCIKPKRGTPPYPRTKSPRSLSASGALSNTLYLSSDKLVCIPCSFVILYYLPQRAAAASGKASDHGSISGGSRSMQGGSSVVTL